MTQPRLVLLLADTRPGRQMLADAVRRVHDAGGRAALVTHGGLPAAYADLAVDEVHSLSAAAREHGPAFRRSLQRVDRAQKFWLHLECDDWVARNLEGGAGVVALTPGAELSAHRLAKRQRGVRVAAGAVLDRMPTAAASAVLGAPRLSERHRYALARRTVLRLLRAGRDAEAERVVRVALRRIRRPRVRADLLGDTVSWALAHGRQPTFAREAYAAELTVADGHYAKRRYDASAQAFAEAARTAFHRVLHFDGLSSPLADDPDGFTEPLRDSSTAQALRAPRGRDRGEVLVAAGASNPRLLIATRINADFLAEIREHFGDHPGFDTRFVDFASATALDRFAKSPQLIGEQTLGGKPAIAKAAESVFRSHLDWADVIFVEWCTALAVLLTQVDPRGTRIVVRMHSYEAFSLWPHLVDFTRVDDVVFVSDHLRDLAVAAIPALRDSTAPRLHVIANAMHLRRFDRPKPDDARFTLALVGASKMVKDPRWAIEVLRHLRAHDARYRLLLIRGHLEDPSAASRAYVEALARDLAELEPSGAVQVLGHTDDVPAALQGVGVVISSSVRESFHQGLVEGAASGAVPVVRDWPFFPGAARQLFPADWVADTPEHAAARILDVTASDQTWRDAGREAADHAIGRWDWQVVQQEFDGLLRRER